MSIDRRTFMQAGAAAMVGWTAACRTSRKEEAIAQATATLAFDFTGLFAFEHWKNTKKLRVLLMDAAHAGHEEHVPFLMIRKNDYILEESNYLMPQIVWLGESFAIWSLKGKVVWIGGDVQGSYDGDANSNLTLNDSSLPFVNMSQLLGNAQGTTSVQDRKLAASQILLTRGEAAPRLPEFQCEKDRLYTFRKPTGPGQPPGPIVIGPKNFASQLSVRHPIAPGTVKVQIADRAQQGSGHEVPVKTIAIRAQAGRDTIVSVLNPAAVVPSSEHFNAFYRLVGGQMPPVMTHTDSCSANVPSATKRSTRAAGDPQVDDPPWARCIPPVLPQE